MSWGPCVFPTDSIWRGWKWATGGLSSSEMTISGKNQLGKEEGVCNVTRIQPPRYIGSHTLSPPPENCFSISRYTHLHFKLICSPGNSNTDFFLRRNSAWHWYTCEKGSIRSFSSRAIEPKNDNKKGELRELSRIWNQVVTICVPFRVLYLLWWSRSTTTRWHQFISFFYPLSYTHKKVARAHIKTA